MSMTEDFVSVRPDINRDQWGRPLVVPPGGGNPTAYTRCTTFVGAIEDTYNLSKWQMRMVALGLADRPDLLLSVASHRDDKSKLNKDCDDALEAAKGRAAATTGTALHALCELIDTGRDAGVVPAAYVADLAAYTAATVDLKPVQVEQFSVLDNFKIGGTPDRVVEYGGKRYISDIKTGSIDFGYLKIAAQLAVYSRATPYDVDKAERLAPHDADTERGIIVHLPAGTGRCDLYWVDLIAGWEAVKVCKQIRDKRSIPKRRIVSPLDQPAATLGSPVSDTDRIAKLITACKTKEATRTVWRKHTAEWNDDLTAIAKAHISTLLV